MKSFWELEFKIHTNCNGEQAKIPWGVPIVMSPQKGVGKTEKHQRYLCQFS